jgi:hypothetical protein
MSGAFTTNPTGIVSGQKVKCLDQSTMSLETIVGWEWHFYDLHTFTNTYPTNPTYLYISTASTFYTSGDTVIVQGGTPPSPLVIGTTYYIVTATPTYVTLSASSTLSPVITLTNAGSGTNTMQHISLVQNPIFTYPATATNVCQPMTESVTGSNGTGFSPYGAGQLFIVGSNTYTGKPLTKDYYNVSILLYNSTHMTLINRTPDANDSLVFTDLSCMGSINRSGTATFTVVDRGYSSANEVSLISSIYTTPTNVAIIVGYNVIWSGTILRATQGQTTLQSTSNQVKIWNIECESCIAMMAKQNVTATGVLVAPAGSIVKSIVNNGVTGDIQWIDAYHSILSFAGPKISYTTTTKDMYSQFQALAKVTGFDWRAGVRTKTYVQTSYSGGVCTVNTPRESLGSLVGWYAVWMGSATAYPTAYGYVSANNGTTTFTVSPVVGTPPAGSASVLLIGPPILDFAADISQPSVQATFTNNAPFDAALYNCYEYDDKTDYKNLITKVVVSAKDVASTSSKGGPASISVSMTAKDAWNTYYDLYQNSAYITYKMDGYVYAYTTGNSYIDLIGQDFSLLANDTFYLYRTRANGVKEPIGPYTVNGSPTLYVGADGVPITRVSATVVIDASVAIQKYSVFVSTKQYVNNYVNLNQGGTYTVITMGGEIRRFKNSMAGTSTTYGPYIAIESTSDIGYSSTTPYPHCVGCLLQNPNYSETAPMANSPVALYGVIQKTIAVDSVVSKGDLDVYASSYLLSNSYYYQRATFWCTPMDYTVIKPPPGDGSGTTSEYAVSFGFLKEGDRIAVIPNQSESPTQFQIVSWEYTANQGKVTVTLGDFDRSVFTLLAEKTNALTGTLT